MSSNNQLLDAGITRIPCFRPPHSKLREIFRLLTSISFGRFIFKNSCHGTPRPVATFRLHSNFAFCLIIRNGTVSKQTQCLTSRILGVSSANSSPTHKKKDAGIKHYHEVTGDIICPSMVQGIDHLRDPRLNKVFFGRTNENVEHCNILLHGSPISISGSRIYPRRASSAWYTRPATSPFQNPRRATRTMQNFDKSIPRRSKQVSLPGRFASNCPFLRVKFKKKKSISSPLPQNPRTATNDCFSNYCRKMLK